MANWDGFWAWETEDLLAFFRMAGSLAIGFREPRFQHRGLGAATQISTIDGAMPVKRRMLIVAATKPFETVELEKPSFLMRLFRRKPTHNALHELNNTLAAAKSIRDVDFKMIDDIVRRYDAHNHKHFAGGLKELYRSYLNHCLVDKRLSETELSELAHLKSILALSDLDVEEINEELCGQIFGESVEEAIADGRLRKNERDFLEQLRSDLKLPASVAKSIFDKAAHARVRKHFDTIVSDERLSPGEEEELEALAKNLGVTIAPEAMPRPLLKLSGGIDFMQLLLPD